jgi:hypothetical protein
MPGIRSRHQRAQILGGGVGRILGRAQLRVCGQPLGPVSQPSQAFQQLGQRRPAQLRRRRQRPCEGLGVACDRRELGNGGVVRGEHGREIPAVLEPR